jgi:hypothetical protein
MKLLKKYYVHLSELINLKTLFTRYFANFLFLIELLLLPKFIDVDVYTEVEYYRNVILILPIFLLGTVSAYLPIYFKKDFF